MAGLTNLLYYYMKKQNKLLLSGLVFSLSVLPTMASASLSPQGISILLDNVKQYNDAGCMVGYNYSPITGQSCEELLTRYLNISLDRSIPLDIIDQVPTTQNPSVDDTTSKDSNSSESSEPKPQIDTPICSNAKSCVWDSKA